MKVNWKRVLSALLVVGSIAAVVWIAFSNSELENAWVVLNSLDPLWALGIFGCWFAYMFFDAFGYWLYFRSEGFRISIGRSINASLICFYYSNITPTSAGGQPMLINSLRKAGVPVGYGTMGSTIRFICNQFVISVLSLIFWVANRDFVHQQLGSVIWLIRLGWIINFAGVPLVLMAAFQRKLIQRISGRRDAAEEHFGGLQVELGLPCQRRHQRHLAHLVALTDYPEHIAAEVQAPDIQ